MSQIEDKCDYYLDLHRYGHCLPSQYPLAFGFKYCKNLSEDVYPHLSDEGKKWFEETQYCLMNKIYQNILGGKINCQDFSSGAINSHYDCYINNGYCDIPQGDRDILLNSVMKEELSLDMIILGIRLGFSCLSSAPSSFSNLPI